MERRKYDSTSRRAAAAATRDRICAVAEARFRDDGYASTTMRAVASGAGVAEATVYLAFPTKAALLDAVIIRATRDHAGESLDAIAAGPADEIVVRLARSNAAVMARAAETIAVGESASLLDAELRPFRDGARRRLLAAFRALADRLDAAGLLRVGPAEAAATMHAIASETTYLRMIASGAVAPAGYAAWLERTLRSVL